MGFRFRKSIKIAPGIKLNLNKKSAGITFGGKGFHHTINTKGKRTTSVGIPGTGLSYSTTSGSGSTKKKESSYNSIINETDGDENMKSKSKKKGCFPAIIISVIILGIVGSCGTVTDETVTTTALSSVSEEMITEEVTTAPSTVAEAVLSTTQAEMTTEIPTTSATEQTTTEKETTTQKETTTETPTTTKKVTITEKKTTTTTKKATTTQKATTKKPTTTQKAITTKKVVTTQKPTTTKKVTTTKKKVTTTKKADATKAVKENSQKIYRTKSGKKYHYENPCGNGTYYEVSLDEALAAGLEPCQKCVLN